MRSSTFVAAAALAAAWPLELLLRAPVWGANVLIGAAICAAAALASTRAGHAASGARGLLAAALLALGSIALVRGPSLLWLAMMVAMVVTGVLMALPDASWLSRSSPIAVAQRLAVALARTVLGPLLPAARGELLWPAGASAPVLRQARGLALSVLVVLPFLALFASADPAFDALARSVVDPATLFTHVLLWGVVGWLLFGWLLADRAATVREPEIALASGEDSWILGGLTLLFTAFVGVQLRYFFGGEERVQAVTGLTYAEYARSGFFELVAVAALLLTVLLGTDWLTRDASPAARRRSRFFTCALLGLLAVILMSALQRMSLYVDAYGLTQLRFFTTAFMLWLVVVFGWYSATVLRGARERFAGGVYVAGVLAVLTLAAVDPIGRIAAWNVRHASERFDVAHALDLGPDAVPALVASIERIPEEERCQLATRIQQRWNGPEARGDWRGWNLSRTRAREAVSEARDRLDALCGPLVLRTTAAVR